MKWWWVACGRTCSKQQLGAPHPALDSACNTCITSERLNCTAACPPIAQGMSVEQPATAIIITHLTPLPLLHNNLERQPARPRPSAPVPALPQIPLAAAQASHSALCHAQRPARAAATQALHCSAHKLRMQTGGSCARVGGPLLALL